MDTQIADAFIKILREININLMPLGDIATELERLNNTIGEIKEQVDNSKQSPVKEK